MTGTLSVKLDFSTLHVEANSVVEVPKGFSQGISNRNCFHEISKRFFVGHHLIIINLFALLSFLVAHEVDLGKSTTSWVKSYIISRLHTFGASRQFRTCLTVEDAHV